MISKDIYGNEYDITVTDLVWRPAAYAVVTQDKSILLIKLDGKYHLPGGGVELGEDPKKTVIREVREESGLLVSKPKLIDAISTFFSWENIDRPQTFSHAHSLLLYYTCALDGGNLGESKLDEYEVLTDLRPEWVELSKLDELIVGTTVDWRPVVKQALTSLAWDKV